MSRPKGIINRKVNVQSNSSHLIGDMIIDIMPSRGMSYRKEDLFDVLKSRFDGNRYKAAGSLGGSSRWKYIKADGPNYVCTRDAHV